MKNILGVLLVWACVCSASERQVVPYHTVPRGVVLEGVGGRLMLVFERPNALRVRYTEADAFLDKDSLIRVPDTVTAVAVEVSEVDGALRISSDEMYALVDFDTMSVAFYEADGTLLVKENCDNPRETALREYAVKALNKESAKVVETVDGERVKGEYVETGEKIAFWGVEHHWEWQDGEALYGLGSHEEDVLNLRGTLQYVYQQNMKASVPVFVSSKGYGVLYDAMCDMVFSDTDDFSGMSLNAVKELDYTVVYGPKLDRVVATYRELTGEVPMLPKWVFGYTQSKERYMTQDEVIGIVKEYRDRQIPLDLIVQDWKYWPTGWGIKEFDSRRYPDPAEMTQRIHDLNAHVIISIWPQITGDHPEKDDMLARGFMLSNDSTYNAYDEKARAAYWDYANKGIFQYGFDGWWCDCTEPIEADWKGAQQRSDKERYEINTEAQRDVLTPLLSNAYSLFHSKGIYENQRATDPDKRVINLTRSAYAGQQRYATISWSGDVNATWEVYRQQISSGLGFMATGLPYWTTDIGAFFVSSKDSLWFWKGDYPEGNKDLGYRELYTRWFQYGAFLPMFRSHGTDTAREVWRFGEPGTPFYDALLESIHLRYRLMPYIYSLVGAVTQDAYTMNRLLAFDFADDPKVLDEKYQFMFGPSLLVCPVTSAMYYASGSTPITDVERVVENYLPTGASWYNFWTGEQIEGGQVYSQAATLEHLPLFVKAGSILPMGPRQQYIGEKADAPWEIRVYPGADATFEVYEDAGDGYEYEEGAFSRYVLEWDDAARTLRIGARSGAFEGLIKKRVLKVFLMDTSVFHGGRGLLHEDQKVLYAGDEIVLQF